MNNARDALQCYEPVIMAVEQLLLDDDKPIIG